MHFGNRLGRRIWHGFTDLGRVAVPPLPGHTVLTDRATGTKYALTHEGDRIGLDDVIPVTGSDLIFYDPFTGPILLADNEVPIMLLVRNGFLGYESTTLEPRVVVTHARPLTRNVREAKTYLIARPAGVFVPEVDTLAYDTVSFTTV